MSVIRDEIKEKLRTIESNHNIKILYACESGSRAWGFPSPDSDYDVRFIYIHPKEWYLSIVKDKDIIEDQIDGDLDVGGWDLQKTLQLILKSNAVVWEWLQSPIVYEQSLDFRSQFLKVTRPFFKSISAAHHYLSMANNFSDITRSSDYIKFKKYFYILRPLMAAKWICEQHDVPPMDLPSLLTQFPSSDPLVAKINQLVERKAQVGEGYETERVKEIEDFIQDQVNQCQIQIRQIAKDPRQHHEILNRFFQTWLIQ